MVVAKECLHSARNFSASCAGWQQGTGVQKEMRGDKTRTAHLNWPKGYPIHKASSWDGQDSVAGHQSAGGEQMSFTLLVCLFFFSLCVCVFFFFLLFLCLIKLPLSQPPHFCTFNFLSSLLQPTAGHCWGGEWASVSCWAAWSNKQITAFQERLERKKEKPLNK